MSGAGGGAGAVEVAEVVNVVNGVVVAMMMVERPRRSLTSGVARVEVSDAIIAADGLEFLVTTAAVSVAL